MNTLDIVLIALLLLPALLGLFKGLTNLLTAFLGIWAAFFLAPLGQRLLSPQLFKVFGSKDLSDVVAYGLGFVLVILLAGVVGWLISRSLKKLDLQWANRLGGAALGLACGLLLSGVMVAALRTLAPDSANLKGSLIAGPVGLVTGFLIPLEPSEALGLTPRPASAGETSAETTDATKESPTPDSPPQEQPAKD
jgi:uncharacterized membrane protein required for colicin V production